MKIIDGIPPVSLKTDQVAQRPTAYARTAADDRRPSSAQGDTVTFSKTAAAVGTAVERLKTMPAVDMEKVAEIKAKLRNGTYRVNAEKAASGMLTEALLQDL